jgi:hypothetical protein
MWNGERIQPLPETPTNFVDSHKAGLFREKIRRDVLTETMCELAEEEGFDTPGYNRPETLALVGSLHKRRCKQGICDSPPKRCIFTNLN